MASKAGNESLAHDPLGIVRGPGRVDSVCCVEERQENERRWSRYRSSLSEA